MSLPDGRTTTISNHAGRDHFIHGWSIVLAGAGIKGGVVYGSTPTGVTSPKTP